MARKPESLVPEQLAAEIDQLRSDIAKLTGAMSDLIENQAGLVRERLSSGAETLATQVASGVSATAERVAALSDTAKGQALDVVDAFAKDVKKNPLAAVGLAVAAGFVIGLITKSRD